MFIATSAPPPNLRSARSDTWAEPSPGQVGYRRPAPLGRRQTVFCCTFNLNSRIEMKSLLILISACLVFVACAGAVSANQTDELHLRVQLTTGERSRDTSSQTRTITVELDAIVWEQTFSGRRNTTPDMRKEFKLSPEDKGKLLELIRSNNLLVTDSIELPLDPPVFYFRILVELTLDGKTGAISLSGPRDAAKIKEEKLYQNTLPLVKELYRIMNTQDKRVHFEELIH